MNSNEFAQNKFYVFTTVIVKAITIQLKRLAFTGRNIETNKWNLRKKNYRDAAFINVLSVGRNLEGNKDTINECAAFTTYMSCSHQ